MKTTRRDCVHPRCRFLADAGVLMYVTAFVCLAVAIAAPYPLAWVACSAVIALAGLAARHLPHPRGWYEPDDGDDLEAIVTATREDRPAPADELARRRQEMNRR